MNLAFLLLFLLLGGLGVIFSGKTLQKRIKRQKRFASLRMNPQEVPLYSGQLLDLNPHPGILIRKISRKGIVVLIGIGAGIFLLLSFIILAIILVLLVALIAPVPSSNVFSFGAILLSGMILFWFFLAIIVVLLLYQRIEANAIGLTVQRGLRRKHISWNQAHLFAVDHKRGDNKEDGVPGWGELSGERKVVRWELDTEISPQTLLQFTPQEYQQGLGHLRSYIHEKTGLPLRDLRSFRKE